MKILLSKPGLDGHDVGVKVLAHGLIEAGHQVVYSGLRKSIEDIVQKAINYNVDMVGLSILSGTHLIIAKKMNDVIKENDLEIPWIVGGNIPNNDVKTLEELGATKAFATSTKVEDVIHYFMDMNETQSQ
ncbi:MAG: methylmalonyl-CoA mutase [Candidatus Marinimicrobia bacterium]|jgi:methylmalonyl-CoA mutase C-terminal domain/subunit|nr:methylmalonyl-CoA mutase [Candidatus Neomarinimicrobiota bacterium]MBT3937812.1 methylmalonyl-CoA mutase [Candidatus Neomarinimicrobiota bacterium]MBT3962197.1 methylmalonyl-CoA mutase [Candidatus Neomarinimicrobiota bacterium]MBT4383239.1 methylmalonyl-CoA mutase [Candidatus Neomarinimicrobiota bacterium]MBT4636893.1 methylmalonyl-CoA mutase [Candidatus Neomarinimicrobiota bacterium]